MKTINLPLSILLVDDSEFFRDGISNFLKLNNVCSHIIEASDGDEALELLEYDKFDLVLLGIRIGPLSGIEVTNLIKAKSPCTKVIGISMFADEFYVLEMFRNGAEAYLLKNVTKDELLLAIQKVVTGENYFPDYLFMAYIKRTDGKIKHAISNKPHIQKRLREIIYLLCLGESSKGIANILELSFHTVDLHKSQLKKEIGSDKTSSLINYGLKIGILHDDELNKKFEKHLLKKKMLA